MIELRNVDLVYGNRDVLKNISLFVKARETKAILGPSGCGKSTIIKLMLGLVKPTLGSVYVDGIDITNMKENNLYPIRKKMGIVFQGNALFDSLTVSENISFFLKENTNLTNDEINERVNEQIRFSGLDDFRDALPEHLSGGMQKRVAIARGLIFNPKMVLLDEPTAGLDPVNSRKILNLIMKMKIEEGLGSVIVTHILSDVKHIADSVCVIYQGKIIFDGEQSLFWKSDHPFIQNFIQSEEI